MPAFPPERSWRKLLELSLEEDVGLGDVTSNLVIEPDRTGRAMLEAREDVVACGLPVAQAIFEALDPAVRFEARVGDGTSLAAGQILAEVTGNLRALLAGERTALNFLGRLCGVATWSRRFVDAVAGTGVRVVDTRKTLPGWRALDKYAVSVGGADNHRSGLFDGILLKDNHLAIAGGVEPAVKAALAGAPAGLRVQVEVETLEDAVVACDAGADFLLLDNCTPSELRAIVAGVGSRALLEASGGVGLANVRQIAETGVHRISIGALTHSAPNADLAMEMELGLGGPLRSDTLGGVAR
jgi:nicotinate-nucleotide pyrophosphorylase (carboxylating)